MKMPGNMMKQAQQMQERMQSGDRPNPRRCLGRRRDGTIGMDGHKTVLSVKIDPEVAGDVVGTADLILYAVRRGIAW